MNLGLKMLLYIKIQSITKANNTSVDREINPKFVWLLFASAK